MSNITQADLIPWDWSITPLDLSNHHCQPPSHILGVFAVVNVISSLLSLVCGNRILIKRVTCGYMGKSNSKWWAVTWVVQCGLMLGANAFNAWLTVSNSQYNLEVAPKIWDLMLFYCTRPRLSWITLVIAENFHEGNNFGQWWTSAAMQTQVTEAVMILFGSLYRSDSSPCLISRLPAATPSRWSALPVRFSLDGNRRPFVLDSSLDCSCSYYNIILPCCYWRRKVWRSRVRVHRISYWTPPLVGELAVFCRICSSSWATVSTLLLIRLATLNLTMYSYCPPSFTLQGFVWVVGSALGKAQIFII